MTKSVFYRLVGLLRVPHWYNSLSPEKVVAICLYRLATIREIANQFSVSESTVVKCTRVVVDLIISQLGNRISWPSTAQELQLCARGFLKYGHIWGCVGALDGSLIQMTNHPGDDSYVDRKNHYSIALQAVCDSNTRFLDIFVGCQGSMNDSRVLRNSPLVTDGLGPNLPSGYFIVADGGYGLESWLMTPFRGRARFIPSNQRFNNWLSRSRVRIEHAFGALKGRWRRLQGLDMKLVNATRSIVACCILHNFLLDENDDWINDNPIPPMPLARNLVPQDRHAAQRRGDQERVRSTIVNQLRRSIVNNN